MIAKPTQRLKLEKPCDLELVGTGGGQSRKDWIGHVYSTGQSKSRGGHGDFGLSTAALS